jgi:hypothetical protein
MGKVQVLAINVGLSRRQRLPRWLEPTGHWNDLCILETLRHCMWRAALRKAIFTLCVSSQLDPRSDRDDQRI